MSYARAVLFNPYPTAPMTSPKQKQLYWREWASVVKACKAQDWPPPDRHELHRRALKADKSMLDLTNAEFDLVLAEFRALSRPTNVKAQMRQLDQPRQRKLYVIQFDLSSQLAVFLSGTKDDRQNQAERMITSICQDKFGHDRIDALRIEPTIRTRRDGTPYESKSELDQLLYTISRLVDNKRQAANLTKAQLESMADKGEPCILQMSSANHH